MFTADSDKKNGPLCGRPSPHVLFGGDAGIIINHTQPIHADAVDAHRAALNGHLEHLHGTVTKEQLGLPEGVVAGEVEATDVVAAGLDAERVRDADVAASPSAIVLQPSGCRSWYPGAARQRQQQQRGNHSSKRYDDSTINRLLHVACVCNCAESSVHTTYTVLW